MTTSTPPAWGWLNEQYVPAATVKESPTPDLGYYPADVDEMCHNYTEAELSLPHHILPDPAPLGAPNDGDQCEVSRSPDVSCGRKDDAKGCDCAAQLTDLHSNAAPEHVAFVCLDCGQARYGEPRAVSTWHVGECGTCGATRSVTEPRDFGNRLGDRHDAEPLVTVEPEPARSAIGAGPVFGVPFSVQSWAFESLCEVGIDNLHDLIDKHHDRILEMARDRFRKGFAKYGSAMYSWSPERRLDETLQELADAVVYPTSGPME